MKQKYIEACERDEILYCFRPIGHHRCNCICDFVEYSVHILLAIVPIKWWSENLLYTFFSRESVGHDRKRKCTKEAGFAWKCIEVQRSLKHWFKMSRRYCCFWLVHRCFIQLRCITIISFWMDFAACYFIVPFRVLLCSKSSSSKNY